VVRAGRSIPWLLLLLGLGGGAGASSADEWLFVPEGNRLHRVELSSLDDGPLRQQVLIPSAKDDPAGGRDINGMLCPLPDGSGRFIASEDTGQPEKPGGWGLFSPEGEQLGKLVVPTHSVQPEPHGCAFGPRGRLFASEVGDPGLLSANGLLVLAFPPFDRFDPSPGRACILADDLGTAGGMAVDRRGRVYVAASGRGAIFRFSPPFPERAEECGAVVPERETFARALSTFSGLAISPRGTLYAASVFTGEIDEYDLDGTRLRSVLDSPNWMPPHPHGTPQGLAVAADGTLYYADLDLAWDGWSIGPGPDGKVWRIRFDEAGDPLPPEKILDGLAFPDGLGIW
jgi:sugar lactone lactonase YvrE